jgi:hypothetical protein
MLRRSITHHPALLGIGFTRETWGLVFATT